MVFNGHTTQSINEIDEETFADISVMFSDGILGGKGIFDAIAPLTAGIFNYLRAANTTPHTSADIFPWVTEYDKNPDMDITNVAKINESLLSFMSHAPGFTSIQEKLNDL